MKVALFNKYIRVKDEAYPLKLIVTKQEMPDGIIARSDNLPYACSRYKLFIIGLI
jgi:hypothetical protein